MIYQGPNCNIWGPHWEIKPAYPRTIHWLYLSHTSIALPPPYQHVHHQPYHKESLFKEETTQPFASNQPEPSISDPSKPQPRRRRVGRRRACPKLSQSRYG